MRVAILSDGIPPESSGGAETIAWSLARSLSRSGHEVHVITSTRGKPFEETRDGIATYHLHSAYPERLQQYVTLYNPSITGPLRALLRRIKPDLLNAHNVQNNLSYWSLAAAHQAGIPVVWNAHDLTAVSFARVTDFIDPTRLDAAPPASYRLPPFHDLRQARLRWNPIRVPVIRAIVKAHTRARMAISRIHAVALEDNGLPPFKVVYNGIDVARFERAKPEAVRALRERLGLDRRRVVMFAGRLRRDKGSLELIRAMDVVTRQNRDVSLLVVADSSFKKAGRIRREFARVIEDHVVESGWLGGDELVAAYHLADVVTVPSIYLDPLVNINLEAMAAGRPVVATCFGGSPEAILDGETGYIVNPFDTERFAGRLEMLLSDDELRRTMGQAGARRAREVFNLDRYAGEMLEVYREVTGKRKD